MDIELDKDGQDEGEPSTPREDIIPVSPNRRAMPLPQLQTPSVWSPANLTSRKPKSLQVNIEDPPSEEVIRGVTEAFLTPLPSSSSLSPLQKKGPISLTAPTLEDLPQEELSPLQERRTKMKQDKRLKKKPRG